MATDEKVAAEVDCLHRYYRFRRAPVDSAELSRFEAWLDYKQAIFRRDKQRCCRCGQVRPLCHLDVRPSQLRPGVEQMAPDNLVTVCVLCEEPAGLIRPRRYSYLA